MRQHLPTRGFTLIETIVYIALLGFLMTATLMCVWSMLESVEKSDSNAVVQGEGSFVLRKLAWALTDPSATPTVGGSGCNKTLSVSKTGYLQNPVVFQRNSASNVMEVRQGGGSAHAITTSNVSASCFEVTLIPASGQMPAGVAATTTINGLTFAITRYVRK